MDSYSQLLQKAQFLVSLGTPVLPNVEYERYISRALTDLQIAIHNLDNKENPLPFEMDEDQKSRALELADKYGIKKVLVEI